METESTYAAPKGLLLSLGIIGILLGAGLVAEFALRIQPCLGCGGTGVGGTINMPVGVGSNTALTFSPATVTLVIGVNNTLTWDNKDTAVHTVTATDGSFDSGDVKKGQSYTHTFTTPGTFSYYCKYHSWMTGKVIVKNQGSGAAGGLTVLIKPGTGADTTLNYSPSTLKLVIGVNNTVTFVNQDSTKHTVTADSGGFDSGDMAPGGSWTHTFAVAGTYSFHCIYHSYMKGTITVVSA